MSASQAQGAPAAEGSYLYGIVPQAAAVPRRAGFGPLRTVCEGDLQAVVSTVSATDWAPEKLSEWDAVAERAQRHQEVLQGLLEHCTPLPMRLGTILHGDDQVHEFLCRAHAKLAGALSAVQGRQEWGIKLTVDRAGLASQVQRQDPELQALEQRMAGTPEGTRYMLEKKRDRLRTQRIDGEQARFVELVRGELGHLAEQRAVLSARDECALNDSLLVETARADALGERVTALNDSLRGLAAIELTGPWPPYSFAPVIQLGQETQQVDG